MEHWDALCPPAPLDHMCSPGHQRGSCSARWFPFGVCMDSVDCIIDNTVIYSCFLGYSKQLSLSELNILCIGSVLLSSVGWSGQWSVSAWFLVQLRGLGKSSRNSHGLESPMGMSWGWAPPEGLWCVLWGSGLVPGSWAVLPAWSRSWSSSQEPGVS